MTDIEIMAQALRRAAQIYDGEISRALNKVADEMVRYAVDRAKKQVAELTRKKDDTPKGGSIRERTLQVLDAQDIR